jgi:hypothetical protein
MTPHRLIALVIAVFALIVTVAQAQDPVLRLVDTGCSHGEVSLSRIQGVKLIASCEADSSAHALHISITNTAPADVGALRAVSVGFCGDAVIGAESPLGWLAEVTRNEDRTTVWWTTPDSAIAQNGLGSGQGVDGFVVRLRPGWRMSQSESVLWESNGVSIVTSRDCARQARQTAQSQSAGQTR